jgi:tetratricopeptide (TPR) repeat protein
MRMKINYLALLFFTFVSIGLAGQESKVRLAYQYYQNNEYEKAAVLFEELYNESKASVYFTYTINSLVQIESYDKAEKLIKKEIRRDRRNLLNYIELGYLYKMKENQPEAEKQYSYVIKNLPVEKNTIVRIANSFLSKREFEFVNQTYEKGRKLIPYQFHLELANSFAYQRKSQQMVDEYLDLLKEDPGKQAIVQNSLQSKMVGTFDENLKEIVKRTLIKRIQKEPRVYVYNELLIWYYIQEENFGSAIIQAKALDKRRHEGGLRLIELGELALQNNEFENAREAFEYVLKKWEFISFLY